MEGCTGTALPARLLQPTSFCLTEVSFQEVNSLNFTHAFIPGKLQGKQPRPLECCSGKATSLERLIPVRAELSPAARTITSV